MSRVAIEAALHWGAVALYVAATAAYAHALIFARPERARWGTWLATAGLLPHALAIASRWIASGHGPYMRRYEVLSSNAWVAIALTLLFVRRRPAWSAVALVTIPCSFLLVALALSASPELRELPPSLRSVWLVFHVGFAKLASGAFLLSVATSVLLLLKLRGRGGRVLAQTPSVEVLDAYTARFVGFGFLFWTINVGAGAIWANQSWGRYWGWDPIETWALVTWLAYGSYLHARLFFRVSGARGAWLALTCFAVAVISVFVLPFVVGSLHAAYFQ